MEQIARQNLIQKVSKLFPCSSLKRFFACQNLIQKVSKNFQLIIFSKQGGSQNLIQKVSKAHVIFDVVFMLSSLESYLESFKDDCNRFFKENVYRQNLIQKVSKSWICCPICLILLCQNLIQKVSKQNRTSIPSAIITSQNLIQKVSKINSQEFDGDCQDKLESYLESFKACNP